MEQFAKQPLCMLSMRDLIYFEICKKMFSCKACGFGTGFHININSVWTPGLIVVSSFSP